MSDNRTRRTRFFLRLADRTEVELQQIALSIGSDGRDYYLCSEGDVLLQNAATKRARGGRR